MQRVRADLDDDMRGGWVLVEKQSRLFGYSSVRFMTPTVDTGCSSRYVTSRSRSTEEPAHLDLLSLATVLSA
jgi:hypothetical protein